MTAAAGAPPPDKEIGYIVPDTGVPGWGYFGVGGNTATDQMEDVPELTWPASVRTYHKMRTDSQIDALTRSVVMPLMRLNWEIEPNGARDEVVEDISKQLNLPIVGQPQAVVPRRRKRFSHEEHLRLALLAPTVYGHMFFEMVGKVDPDTLAWTLSKLAPRMPQTVQKIKVARDGGLESITQYGNALKNEPIPVGQLVAYPWEKEGANWTGRSMLRPLYKHWVIKDLLLRIDTMKNERWGLGVPVGTAAPGGDPNDMQKMASAIRASATGGTGLPNGATMAVQGVTGTLPDTLASIRYQDEAMARSFLAMFMQLGQTETGSRALGESFVDFFVDALAGFANWYANLTTSHVIEDIVDWNWGEDEPAPRLVWSEKREQPLSIADLAQAVTSGALVMDAELQKWVRDRYSMPEYDGTGVLRQLGSGLALSRDASPRVAAYREDQKRDGTGKWAPEASEDDDLTAARVPDGKEAKITFLGSRQHDHAHAAAQTIDNPAIGHREPNEHEVRAGVDFAGMQSNWESAVHGITDEWKPIQALQVAALVASIKDAVAAGDITALATVSAPVLGADLILKHMTSMATLSAAAANAEAVKQGLKAADVDVSTLGLAERSEAIATLLSGSISGSAARNAVLSFGGSDSLDPDAVADDIQSKLEGLSDSYLNDTLGGAMTQAQNTGRRAVMSEVGDDDTDYYASELLDQNTCSECAAEDGTQFASLSDSETFYPAGGYKDCLGGPRCRGTIVAVYAESE